MQSEYNLDASTLDAYTMTNLSAADRAALVAKISSLEIFALGDSVVAFAPATDAVALGVPGSALVVHAGSSWGPNVAAAVVQSVAPDPAGLAALGLNGTARLFLIAVDRMGAGGDLITTGADFCFTVTPSTTTLPGGFRVLSYPTGSTTPIDIETEGGNITEANGTYTVCATHTSTFTSADSSDNSSSVSDPDSDSDKSLWGLMALGIIPLALAAYAGWRYEKSKKPKEPAYYPPIGPYVPGPGPARVPTPHWSV